MRIIEMQNSGKGGKTSAVLGILAGGLALSVSLYSFLRSVKDYRRLAVLRTTRKQTRIADSGQGETWYQDLV